MTLRSPSFSWTRPKKFAPLFLALSLSLIGCVKRPRDASLSSKSREQAAAPAQTTQTQANDQQSATSPQTNSPANQENAQRTNINTASAQELEKLPGIGKALAARIIEHREKYGPFRRAEHLIMVRGFSDRRFRALRDLITVE